MRVVVATNDEHGLAACRGLTRSLAGIVHFPSSRQSGYVDRAQFEQFSVPIFTLDRGLPMTDCMGFVDALDVDVVFCCGWSRIVPLDMLEKYVVVGMHPTRLPDGRGGAPIPRTVLRGIQHSAVSFYVMTEDVDFGDVALQVPFDIASDADAAYVYAAVKSIVENHSGDALRNVVDGRFVVRKSEFAGSDISPQRKPRQSLVDWDRSAEDVLRFVRALSRPYPNAFAKCDGSVVRFHSPGVVCDDGIGPFSFRVDDGLVVGCGDMSVRFANEDFSCSEPIPLNGEFECNRLHGE